MYCYTGEVSVQLLLMALRLRDATTRHNLQVIIEPELSSLTQEHNKGRIKPWLKPRSSLLSHMIIRYSEYMRGVNEGTKMGSSKRIGHHVFNNIIRSRASSYTT